MSTSCKQSPHQGNIYILPSPNVNIYIFFYNGVEREGLWDCRELFLPKKQQTRRQWKFSKQKFFIAGRYSPTSSHYKGTFTLQFIHLWGGIYREGENRDKACKGRRCYLVTKLSPGLISSAQPLFRPLRLIPSA